MHSYHHQFDNSGKSKLFRWLACCEVISTAELERLGVVCAEPFYE